MTRLTFVAHFVFNLWEAHHQANVSVTRRMAFPEPKIQVEQGAYPRAQPVKEGASVLVPKGDRETVAALG
jgi:hypothetical protein